MFDSLVAKLTSVARTAVRTAGAVFNRMPSWAPAAAVFALLLVW